MSLPIVGLCAEGGVYGETESHSLLFAYMWVFFLGVQCMGVSKRVSGFLSQGIIALVAIDLGGSS